MDPLTILTTLWRYKWVTVPITVLTLAACAYVYLYGPRTYQANVSYALAAPDVPSGLALERDPALAKLNSDNPYLRSGDSSLLAQVVITKLSDPAYIDQLKAAGFGTEFKIAPVASLGMGLVIISATSTSEDAAVATAKLVGDQFTSTLNSVQTVRGADERYLYSPILVLGPGPAEELFSNRLRSLVMVGIAGSVLLFGSVSVARGRTLRLPRGATATSVEVVSRSKSGSYPEIEEEEQNRKRPDQPEVTRASRRARRTAFSPGPDLSALSQPPISTDQRVGRKDENGQLVAAGDRTPAG
jgi:hypothetical protein